ncbi:MAG: DUF2634 domain-containing protein [Bacillota bacterium]|nr:DUF2634 domain-containing protein [Bacillota bacterium]
MTLYYFESVLPETAMEISDGSILGDETYRLTERRHRFRGTCSGSDSLQQSIAKRLSTEQGAYSLYSDDYGVAFDDLWDMPIALVETEVEERIRRALLVDDRIYGVKDFEIQRCENGLYIQFTVATAEEETTMDWRVEYD